MFILDSREGLISFRSAVYVIECLVEIKVAVLCGNFLGLYHGTYFRS